MAQRAKVLAYKTELDPRDYIKVERELTPQTCPLTSVHMLCMLSEIIMTIINKKNKRSYADCNKKCMFLAFSFHLDFSQDFHPASSA